MDLIPPYVVRRLARKPKSKTSTGKHRRRRRLTTAELARESGLSINTVNIISRKRSWATVKIGVAQAFCAACGHDPLRPRRNIQYLKRFIQTGRGFRHLTRQELAKFADLTTQGAA